MKKIFTLIALGFVGALRVHGQLANGIEAVVHDSIITKEDVDTLNQQTAELLRRQYRDQPEVLEKKLKEMQDENEQKLVANRLILHEFKVAGYNLPQSIIDDEVNSRIRSKFGGDRLSLTKTLESEGMTNEKFRERVRDQFIVEVMRSKNVAQELIISPHKVETYYLAHRDAFNVDDEVKLRMIVLNKSPDTNTPPADKLAAEILSKIKEGAAFDEMAKVYSQGSYRNQGGEWGWFERNALRKELADAAFAVKPGVPSPVIDTPEACYVMLVEDRRSAHPKSLGEVRDQIEHDMLLEDRNRLEKEWIDRLRKKTFVRFM
jgi:peptidyl-prolyl cis-trans isomerase SurA